METIEDLFTESLVRALDESTVPIILKNEALGGQEGLVFPGIKDQSKLLPENTLFMPFIV